MSALTDLVDAIKADAATEHQAVTAAIAALQDATAKLAAAIAALGDEPAAVAALTDVKTAIEADTAALQAAIAPAP